ncbi:MAG: iron-containing alcohol dehydrogenase [Lachnospiraceae bacterium]|nr:iron-containing alcohol dehydrogenase [Lachnospiraceae bacterium]
MVNFEYYNPAKIIFGTDVKEKLKKQLAENKTSSLLLIYSGEFVKDLGIYDIVKSSAEELGITFAENGNVVPNPEISLVRELIATAREKKTDLILAVGGGSSVDTAKAVALGTQYQGDPWDFFEQGAYPAGTDAEHVLKIGVITTLPSSGSETSNAAILSNGTRKVGFEDNAIIPSFAIMNPEYTFGLPRFQTAAGVADILSHILERYFSDVKHTDVTDYLLEGAAKALFANGPKVLENPKDYDARAEIQWLASIAHNNLLDTGRIGDWGSHRIEHELSAFYGITHGEGMAIVLPAWMKYMAGVKPWKIAQFAVRVLGADTFTHTEEENALYAAESVKAFYKSLGLKTSLTELGINEEHFDEMAAQATKNGASPVGHYVPLDEKRFKEILKLAL